MATPIGQLATASFPERAPTPRGQVFMVPDHSCEHHRTVMKIRYIDDHCVELIGTAGKGLAIICELERARILGSDFVQFIAIDIAEADKLSRRIILQLVALQAANAARANLEY